MTAELTWAMPTGMVGGRWRVLCGAEVPQLEGVDVSYQVRLPDGDHGWDLAEITLRSLPGRAEPIGVTELRSVPVADLLDLVRRWMIEDGTPIASVGARKIGVSETRAWKGARSELLAMIQRDTAPVRTGRRPTWTDNELRTLAERAVAIGAEHPRNWQQRLARELFGDLDDIEASSRLRHAIGKARSPERGWLAPARGRGDRNPPRPGDRLLAVQSWETTNDTEDS